MTIGGMPRTLGLVGSRAYEVQASRSPGARALDMAVWECAEPMLAERGMRKPMLEGLYETFLMALGRGPDR
jgi:hypothetical protein